MDVGGFIALVSVVFGAYCIYGFYLVKWKQEIPSGILLPKDVSPRKCKDLKAYCKECEKPLLLLGILCICYGAFELLCLKYTALIKYLMIGIVLIVVSLLLFAVLVKKINQKYFDI